MNESLKCPQCGGNKFSVQGYNSYKCLYCGTTFTPAPPAPPTDEKATVNAQNEPSGASNIIVNVNVPNNTPRNIGEPLSFSNIHSEQQYHSSKGKNKITAGVLGIFLGAFGGHHFYLGNTGRALAYLFLFWTYLPGIIGFIEGIMFLCMNDNEFDRKYNY